MVFALAVALAAVLLGLGLGLFPGAGRRALGPLRTLALAAVIGVAVLHLLPEALGGLGLLGVLVFALGLAIPRWVGRAHHENNHGSFGLDVGFVGLLIHHLGDGLGLGVYSRMDAESGYTHGDVVIALVLHTVPLVAVVSAGYARSRGVKSAVLRSLALAGASVFGILMTGFTPESLVERVEAWIAAGVAGLLLHGMSHDLTEDLPHTQGERALDFAAATLGLFTGYVGALLDASSGHSGGLVRALGTELLEYARAAALPIGAGLALSAFASRFPGLGTHAPAPLRSFTGVFAPETLLLGLVLFGWGFVWVLPIAGAVLLVLHGLRVRATREGDAAPEGGWGRLDRTTAWAFSGIAVASVLGSALSERAFDPLGVFAALGAVAILALALPIHAVLGPLLAAALVESGLSPAAGIALSVLGPLLAVERTPKGAVIVVLGTLLPAALLGKVLSVGRLSVPPALASLALGVLALLTLARIYERGFRGWLSAMGATPADQRSRTAKGSATTTGSPDASGASTPA